MNSESSETPHETGAGDTGGPGGTEHRRHSGHSRKRIVGVYGFAVLLALVLFYFHVIVIFDVIGEMLHYKAWLTANIGPKDTGKLLLLGCFFALMLAHITQAGMWGLYLRQTKLVPTFTDGVYFTGASITTLGYGDILLSYPWRHIGTLIAITGVLMFGCSTAFLFVVLQGVWQHF